LAAAKVDAQGQKITTTTNWISPSFQSSAEKLAADAIKRFLKSDVRVVGLGSGPMAAAIVRRMSEIQNKEDLECVVTSYQIKLEAECSGLKVVDENRISDIDLVFDGADEVNSKFDMIKGGGGALFREKIIHTCSKKIVIAAESYKFVQIFSWPIPIEVHPFGISLVRKELQKMGGQPVQRMLKEGYPYVTENGNFILDTKFGSIASRSSSEMESQLKNIPGVIEAGLFTKHADAYYEAKSDGTFEVIEPDKM
jgi:ribose 5-phosphate isomerase A